MRTALCLQIKRCADDIEAEGENKWNRAAQSDSGNMFFFQLLQWVNVCENVWILTLSATIIRGVVLVIFKVKGGLMMWDQVACSKTQAIKNPIFAVCVIFALCNYGKKKVFEYPEFKKTNTIKTYLWENHCRPSQENANHFFGSEKMAKANSCPCPGCVVRRIILLRPPVLTWTDQCPCRRERVGCGCLCLKKFQTYDWFIKQYVTAAWGIQKLFS